jgi:iron complex outermembrane receptor protein
VLIGLLVSAPVAAQPAVDVADLPPLPAASDDPSSSATVLAASSAEEDVVVGAAKREQSLGNVASAVTVITADRIRRFGYRTVGEAVASVAGAYLVDNRLSYSVGIRGLQIPGDFNTRLLVLIDGASVNEAWGAFAGLGFDALVGIDDIARIEVIRGPVSSVYGTNAFFGIINIVTRGAAETPRAWVRAAVNSITGPTTAVGFATGKIDRQLRGAVHFMNRFGETLNVAIPDGAGVEADASRAFVGGIVGAWGGTFAQVRASRWSRESPFAPYDVNPLLAPYEQFDTHLLAEGGHTRELSNKFTLAARAYANIYDFNDTSPPYDPIDQPTPLDTTGAARTVGSEVRGRHQFTDEVGVTAGIEASYNRTESTALYRGDDPANTIVVPANFVLAGAYAEAEAQPVRWLGFTGGLRFDHYDELVASDPQSRSRLSPRAALFVSQPQKYGLKLLYAEGFRNPSAFEGKFEDGSDFTANPEIEAETIRSFEAVVWAKPAAGMSTRVSGWFWDARGIVEQRSDPVDPALLQFQNVTRYVSAGVEAEASYRTSSGWYAFGGAAYASVATEDDAGSLVYDAVPNAPAITASGGISTPLLLGYAHLSSELNVIGERPTRADENGDPSPRSPAWVGWNWTIYVPNLRGFDLTAGVRNLIGKRDQLPAPGDYDRSLPDVQTVPRVPGEGRELYVKLGYSY